MNVSRWQPSVLYTAIFRASGFCRVDLRQVRSLLDAGREDGLTAIRQFQYVERSRKLARRSLEHMAAATLI
ncbi:hypothetical protein A8E62_35360 [Burkholderia cenocepacia]|nr:hypothetical protein A8E04_33260 [Burkholderia cenocepacia]ONU45425.1 hypothetical protein A8E62_35360 [Burkholderia cenocepacia]